MSVFVNTEELELNPHMICLLEKQLKAYDSLPVSFVMGTQGSFVFNLLGTYLGSFNTQNCHSECYREQNSVIIGKESEI